MRASSIRVDHQPLRHRNRRVLGGAVVPGFIVLVFYTSMLLTTYRDSLSLNSLSSRWKPANESAAMLARSSHLNISREPGAYGLAGFYRKKSVISLSLECVLSLIALFGLTGLYQRLHGNTQVERDFAVHTHT
jgi:hypothetical protein